MRTVVVGRGYLGTRIAQHLGDAVLADVDITDARAVGELLQSGRFDVLINAAGKTGRPNVDWCESHRDETWSANVTGVGVLAEQCQRSGTHIVHLSSGCMFDGPSPLPGGWRESDAPSPCSYYGHSKVAGERALDGVGATILRLRMPIDAIPAPRNTLTKLASYASVVDAVNSLTVVDDLLTLVAAILPLRAAGTFHATNPGSLSHRELLELYRRIVDPTHHCNFLTIAEFERSGLALARRSSCVLHSGNLEALGLSMRPIDVALPDILGRYAVLRGQQA